jgi:Ser/Thr protein kinase RdoA (MazF antagonist)
VDTLAPLDRENAFEALQKACAIVGVDAAGAELIRLGENAVYRLHRAPLIARVRRSASRLPEAVRELAVARWLNQQQIPAIKPLAESEPIVAAGRVVTFWESASDLEEYGTAAELGEMLRKLHSSTAPAALGLPVLAPFDRADKRLSDATGLDDADELFLRDRCMAVRAAFEGLTFDLPSGVIHGDANVGNLIRDRDGRPLLADLDGFCIGPREWDLALTAIYYERFGWHTAEEYTTFVEAYGYDVMTWDGYPVLRDVRELLMVAWLAQNAAGDVRVGAELNKRIATLRVDSTRRTWEPF